MSNEITLTPQEEEKIRKSVESLKQKYQKKLCKHCGDPIIFKEYEGRVIPHNVDGIPHWNTCPYSGFAQKKTALGILKKIAFHFAVHDPEFDLENKFGLSKTEGKVFHALLEKLLKTLDVPDPVQVVNDDLSFKPEPTDPIGDPDEELAPAEELIDATPEGELLNIIKEE